MSAPLYRSRPGGFDIRPASQSQAVAVADGVYVSEGLSNSYLVVTSEGRVVVNTGMGFEAPVHRRNFDAVDPGPVRYVLLTQGHVDHVGGVGSNPGSIAMKMCIKPFLKRTSRIDIQRLDYSRQADSNHFRRFRMPAATAALAERSYCPANGSR